MQDKTAVKKQRAFNDCVYKARKYTGKKCCTSNKCTSIQAEQANTDCATRLYHSAILHSATKAKTTSCSFDTLFVPCTSQ